MAFAGRGALLGAAIVLWLLLIRVAVVLLTPGPAAVPGELRIAPGDSVAQIAHRLQQQGVVADARVWRYLARLTGADAKLQAGTYSFPQRLRPAQVLLKLVEGQVVRRRVTIPEGFTIARIARRLQERGLAPAAAITTLSQSPQFLQSLKVPGPNLEGYLYPETYYFPLDQNPRQLLRHMVQQTRQRLIALRPFSGPAAGLSDHELLTLASIVQQEAASREEMPLIAAVFYNRLDKGMRLQADPTVRYALPHAPEKLSHQDLRYDSPYNTYRYGGLPPGPIASPGPAALAASARPAAVDYLYFVSKGNGRHAFSRTLQEHNKAVQEYQR